MDELDLNDIELNSKTGKWVGKFAGKRRVVEKELYLSKLKAATIRMEDLRSRGEDDRSFKKAQREYNFYYQQLDEASSNTFVLSMYGHEQWKI